MTTLKISEAANILDISIQAAYMAVRKGRLNAKKCEDSNRWRTKLEDIEHYRKTRYSRAGRFDKSQGIYSIPEAAKLLNINAQKIYYSTRIGILKAHRKGVAWFLHIDDINEFKEKYLMNNEQPQAM
jgi:hypothetical protein